MGKGTCVYRMLVGKSQGNSLLGKSRRSWEYKIKMNLQGVGWGHGLG